MNWRRIKKLFSPEKVVIIKTVDLSEIPNDYDQDSTQNSKVQILTSMELIPPDQIVVGPKPISKHRRRKGKTIKVKPAELQGPAAELEEIGWVKRGSEYRGWFKVNGYFVEGRLVKHRLISWRVYVKNPPPAIFIGHHGACFPHTGSGWYLAHFRKANFSDPVSLIRTVQRYFDHCYERRLSNDEIRASLGL